MIKQSEITEINVDDYIRERKKTGSKYIRWGKNGWKRFSDFFEATTGCGIGIFNIDINTMDNCIKNHNHKPKNVEQFLGIRHYKGY